MNLAIEEVAGTEEEAKRNAQEQRVKIINRGLSSTRKKYQGRISSCPLYGWVVLFFVAVWLVDLIDPSISGHGVCRAVHVVINVVCLRHAFVEGFPILHDEWFAFEKRTQAQEGSRR